MLRRKTAREREREREGETRAVLFSAGAERHSENNEIALVSFMAYMPWEEKNVGTTHTSILYLNH
jgi:hypothetical protein